MSAPFRRNDAPVGPVGPFTVSYLSEPFPTAYDPLLFHGDAFDDGQHRAVVLYADSHKAVYKTVDFDTWTLVNGDWMPLEPDNGGDTFQDYVRLPDGTFVLYQNDGSENDTAVWTGTAADIDAGTITKVGRVLSTDGDCGAFYEAATNLIHIFTEDPAAPFGTVSSYRLNHWTTPADDLLNATFHGVALDTGGTWGTGDPDIIEVDGIYYMFFDYTESHPTYWVGLARSADLYTWEILDETFTSSTGVRAGDFDTIDMGTYLIALSEYTGGEGVGLWRLDKN